MRSARQASGRSCRRRGGPRPTQDPLQRLHSFAARPVSIRTRRSWGWAFARPPLQRFTATSRRRRASRLLSWGWCVAPSHRRSNRGAASLRSGTESPLLPPSKAPDGETRRAVHLRARQPSQRPPGLRFGCSRAPRFATVDGSGAVLSREPTERPGSRSTSSHALCRTSPLHLGVSTYHSGRRRTGRPS